MKKIIVLWLAFLLLFSFGCANTAESEPLATFEAYSMGRLDQLDLSEFTPEDAATVERAITVLTEHYGSIDSWSEPESDLKNIERIQQLLSDNSVSEAEKADLDYLLLVLS